MLNKLQTKIRNRKGFTLVELLIVIAVLGIIAAIAVPRFTGVLSGVRTKADVRAAELWSKEIEAEFMVKNWTFPTTGTATIAISSTDGTSNNSVFSGTVPKSSDGTAYLHAVLTNTAATATTPRKVVCVIYKGTVSDENKLITKDLTLPID